MTKLSSTKSKQYFKNYNLLYLYVSILLKQAKPRSGQLAIQVHVRLRLVKGQTIPDVEREGENRKEEKKTRIKRIKIDLGFST